LAGHEVESPASAAVRGRAFHHATGQNVAWFYFRNDPLVAKTAGVLLKVEARRMAVNFVCPPLDKAELMRGRRVVVPGFGNKAVTLLTRLLPRRVFLEAVAHSQMMRSKRSARVLKKAVQEAL
jgi:hypothetical protein